MVRISVVIPSYNCAAYLPKAIESVLAQDREDLEILVVDDGSTDSTRAVVAPYLTQIQYIHQANKGLPGARNTGIRQSRGEFIALLDADDAWLPGKLTAQMPFFEEPQVGIVYSDFAVQYSDGRTLPSYLAERPLASEGWVVDSYIRSRFLFPSTMVLRRAAVEQCGLFDEEMTAAEDIELFTRICLRWQVRRAPGVWMLRTEGTHNITGNTRKMSDYTILAFRKIVQREPDLPPATRRMIAEEMGRQYFWRAYGRFKAGQPEQSRGDFVSAIRCDLAHLSKAGPLLLASLLPRPVLRRLTSDSTDRR